MANRTLARMGGSSPARPDATAASRTVIRRFFRGVGFLLGGFRSWGTSPGIMLLGALPALLVGAVYLTAIVLLVLNLGDVATWATPFAGQWDGFWRDTVRVAVALALIAGALVLAAVTFTAVTVTIGDPFYERIWHTVEVREGNAPSELEESFWAGVARSVRSGALLLLRALGIAILVGVVGLIPLVGAVLAPVLGAILGGWTVALELTGYAFEARGHGIVARRRMLRGVRAEAYGFGMATYLVFLVPVAAVIVMPAAVAGATLLAREAVRGEPAGPGRDSMQRNEPGASTLTST
jgi:CysZ protein